MKQLLARCTTLRAHDQRLLLLLLLVLVLLLLMALRLCPACLLLLPNDCLLLVLLLLACLWRITAPSLRCACCSDAHSRAAWHALADCDTVGRSPKQHSCCPTHCQGGAVWV